MVTIPVPTQPELHKQWCLFDDRDNIDFDKEVRRIAENTNEVGREGKTLDASSENSNLNEVQEAIILSVKEVIPNVEEKEDTLQVKESLDKNITEILNSVELYDEVTSEFLAQLTLLDVQSPVKRDIEPFFSDVREIKNFARGVKEIDQISMKNENTTTSKRHQRKSLRSSSKKSPYKRTKKHKVSDFVKNSNKH